MKKLFTLILLAAALGANAQNVGINTASPKATLEVVGAPATAGAQDGIIPPKLTRAQLIAKTGYGADQIGAVIYVTDLSGTVNTATANVVQTGLYTFDGTTWNSTRPKFIGFHVYRTTAYNVAAGGSTTIYFNNEEYDTNDWYNPANGRFTPKVAGYYQINAGMRMYNGSTGERVTNLFKNGTLFLSGTSMTGGGAASIVHTVSAVVYFDGVNDYVNINVYSETTMSNVAASKPTSYFQGYLIGQ